MQSCGIASSGQAPVTSPHNRPPRHHNRSHAPRQDNYSGQQAGYWKKITKFALYIQQT